MVKLKQDKIINTLNDKWKSTICYMCKSNDWIVQDKVFELREINGLLIDNSLITPLLLVTCTNCGNVVMINPMAIGLFNG